MILTLPYIRMLNRPFCLAKGLLAGFAGSFAHAHPQHSRGAMMTETL